MHELALCQDIVRTALDAVEVRSSAVVSIALEVGALSSVNMEALEFCMRIVLDQEGLPHTRVEMTPVPARARCGCGAEYEPEDVFGPCPECEGFDREFIGGTDLTIRHVEVADEQS